MLNKFLTVLGVGVLICFSFYYTDSAVNIAIRNDPIMKEIINVSLSYEKGAVDAVLLENNIIPGVCGEVIDIDKSYENMKRYGEFNSSLLVLKEVLPSVSVVNAYDKYIISGNSEKMNVSIIIKFLNTNYLEDIVEILKTKNIKANFFLDEKIFKENDELLRLIFLSGNDIDLYSNEYTSLNIGTNNRILSSVNMKNLKYCYTEYENDLLLDTCSNEKLYTIKPSIITDKTPYMDIKKGLESGSIIAFNNNSSVVRELNSIINYIMQKGYKVVLLEELLKE